MEIKVVLTLMLQLLMIYDKAPLSRSTWWMGTTTRLNERLVACCAVSSLSSPFYHSSLSNSYPFIRLPKSVHIHSTLLRE